ncbi:UNVERIFIED_CONTAM: hypothetical protein Scaly_1658300 [Sesamum calycinum]|uniref:Reverse transcriptase Ty1/copia-type domain-containing protein n=1 Tax=Sesamum calycinum TaxID=2727403 RepID=A0AAW2NSR6_9LAMI
MLYSLSKIFFGWEIARSADGMSVTQRKYVNDIITDTGLIDAHSVLIPLPQGVKFGSNLGAPLYDPEKYRRLIGRLLYDTRLDLFFYPNNLSSDQFLHCELFELTPLSLAPIGPTGDTFEEPSETLLNSVCC